MQIVPEETESVRLIFGFYIQENGVWKNKKYLESHGIKTVTGKAEWSISTIDQMLSNEEICGASIDAENLYTKFSDGQERKEPWAVRNVSGGERPRAYH